MPSAAVILDHSQRQPCASFCSQHALQSSTAKAFLTERKPYLAWKLGRGTSNLNHPRHIKACRAKRRVDGLRLLKSRNNTSD